ncbi:HlyD family secretion protein [Nitrospirillum sp. BR 11828]|uniref:HlyD family secretion protein n=1 Tax=Nitrospirillum sp. BR 11828 TaxID=3104325 RepID=UPI002ACA32E1|nr:HlyD family secretion protein [Nitrospirillum sp. BR 11828]MDZ5650253.1 HlyD family secretion protein [Nitrospirillum sp. BR 11828]
MRSLITTLTRLAITLAVVAVAALVGWRFWIYYMEEPWTRDGRVRADIVGVTPDVSGLVDEVLVRDNQTVTRGQVLFRIDKARFTLALQQADAAVAAKKASFDEAVLERNRYQSLSASAVSREKQEQTIAAAREAEAVYLQAVADRNVAKLNLDRTEVVATVNGYITNFDLRPGDYVTAGKAVTALVDSDSLHVQGYFEETKLGRIHVGDTVTVRLMGDPRSFTGHVESIAAAIEDRERTDGSNLLANVNPTFSWVRLAQRIPVRVILDHPPADLRLIPGRTATVAVVGSDAVLKTPLTRLPHATDPQQANPPPPAAAPSPKPKAR